MRIQRIDREELQMEAWTHVPNLLSSGGMRSEMMESQFV